MTNFRYGFSFIISSILYTALAFSLLTFLNISKEVTEKPTRKVIKIAIITPTPPKPKVIVPPVVVPTPLVIVPPKEIVKPKPKEIEKKVIKKPKPKPKKIIKKVVKKTKPKPKKIIKKEKPVEKEYFTPAPTKAVQQPKAIKTPTPIQPIPTPKVDKNAEKRAFLRGVRNQIKHNKKYPKMALRRHIEGSVGVMFDIGTNGNVSNIRFLNGKSILQKSVRKAVTRSFPINIPNNLKSEFPMYNISVTVNFRIN